MEAIETSSLIFLVNNHICELQIHLRAFYELKVHEGHFVYELTRTFKIPNTFRAEDLLEDLSPKFRHAEALALEHLKKAEEYCNG